MVKALKDPSHLYDVEHSAIHAEREGFRIGELTLSTTQKVPWHYHNNITDTFYVLTGEITIYLRKPKEKCTLQPGEIFEVPPTRPHLVTNSGSQSATFLVMQGMGEYDFVPLT